MAKRATKKRAKKQTNNGTPLGFEATLWAAADKLRNNMDAAEYKHVVLGLIFLKYISDAFEEQHAKLHADQQATERTPKTPTNTGLENIFWVPKEARWSLPAGQREAAHHRQSGRRCDDRHRARQPDAQGRTAEGIRSARSSTRQRLGELIDLIGNIGLGDQRAPIEGHPRASLRILSLAVRQR